jgi:hypothetical protein
MLNAQVFGTYPQSKVAITYHTATPLTVTERVDRLPKFRHYTPLKSNIVADDNPLIKFAPFIEDDITVELDAEYREAIENNGTFLDVTADLAKQDAHDEKIKMTRHFVKDFMGSINLPLSDWIHCKRQELASTNDHYSKSVQEVAQKELKRLGLLSKDTGLSYLWERALSGDFPKPVPSQEIRIRRGEEVFKNKSGVELNDAILTFLDCKVDQKLRLNDADFLRMLFRHPDAVIQLPNDTCHICFKYEKPYLKKLINMLTLKPKISDYCPGHGEDKDSSKQALVSHSRFEMSR